MSEQPPQQPPSGEDEGGEAPWPNWQPSPAPAWPPPEEGYPTTPAPQEPAPPAAYPPPPPPPPQQAPPVASPPPPPQQAPPAGYPPPPPPPPAAPPYAPPPAAPPAPGYAPPPAWQPPVKARGPHGEPIFQGVECASWGSRVGAYLLDLLFAFIIPFAAGIPFAASGVNGLEIVGGILIGFSFVSYYLLYAPLLMMRRGTHNGQTWGKQIVGIRVMRNGGEPMGFGWGLLREAGVRFFLIGLIGGFFFIPPLLDVLWPLWDDENRALHDMVVSTHVVRAEEPAAVGSVGLT